MRTLIVDAPANEPPHRYLLDFTPAGPIKSPNPRPASEQTTPDLVAGAPPAVTVRTASPKPGARRSFWRSAAFLGLVLPGLAAFGWSQRGGNPGFNSESVSLGSPDKLVYHSVQRHDLPITITERGTLSSQQEIRINCDLETVPGQSGTRILWIVPNGTAVKAGEPLVEFDSAPLKDRLNTQSVVYEQARAAQIQASVRFENQKTQNETNLAAAKLRVEVAQLGLTMYEDESGGAFKIAISDLDSKIQEARNQISEAQAALKMKHARRKGVETLFKLGYR
ncbi:MAG: hypothetical protein EHM42_02835, partial [Planctomycetaceae bacterium]